MHDVHEATLRTRTSATLRNLPWWAVITLLYIASRVYSSGLLGGTLGLATWLKWGFAYPPSELTFFGFSGMWDAPSYREIGESGYPAELPRGTDDHVLSNTWAFLPLYPTIVRVVVVITGMSYYGAACIVATIFGLAAVLMLYKLVSLRASSLAAKWSAIFFMFGPMAFILQVAYAESMFFFLTFVCLYLLVKRQYMLMISIGVAAGFTRPGILPVALALGIHLVVRWVTRERDPLSGPDIARIIAAGLSIAAVGFIWPVIVSTVTGEPNAYLLTEMSWWVGLVGRAGFVPFTPWFLFATTYLGVFGVVLVLAAIGGFVWWLTRRSVRALGHEFVGFGASYGAYLVAVFLPQQSIFRLLMPLAPLLGDESLWRTRRRRTIILVAGMALQPVAIFLLWFIGFP